MNNKKYNNMGRLKIDYGIDLGTTNSAICRMENGEPVIKKTDTLKDTLPSCIFFTRKKSIVVGDYAYANRKKEILNAFKSKNSKPKINAFVEFKRTMGTDTPYISPNMQQTYSSENLSSEVLKTLKSFVTDEAISSSVITVPARFNAAQVAATQRAAKMAGIEHCEILQEPIAASMAYGLTTQEKNGYWLVFDFGGGTFDAALVKVEDGIMQVFDTAGNNYLGGKNLDEAIVNGIIIPYLKDNYSLDETLEDINARKALQDAMKCLAEEAKIDLSFKESHDIITDLGDLGDDDDGEEIVLDLTITQEELFAVMRPVFQKAVDICVELMQRNNLDKNSLNKLILVGGPTHSPLIRQMLKEQVTSNVDTSIDPMTAVACGAALYASTIDNEVKTESVAGTVMLEVGYKATTVDASEWVSIKLDAKNSEWGCPEKVWVELTRHDKSWSSGKVEISSIGDVIEAALIEGKPNSFTISVYDDRGVLYPSFPNEITIIPVEVPNAVLPHSIGIEVWKADKGRTVFTSIPGLEKNHKYPATGKKKGLRTTQQLRPGVERDILKISIYQAEDLTDEGKSASLFDYIDDIIITGLEVDELIPQGSEVDLTVKAVKHGIYNIDVYFPQIGFTISKPYEVTKVQQSVSETYLATEIKKARNVLTNLKDEGCETMKLEQQLNDVQTELSNGAQKEQILGNLRKVLRSMEDLEASSEWERLEKNLRIQFAELEKDQQKYGNEKSASIIEQLRPNVDQVIRSKDVKLGKEVLKQVEQLDYRIAMVEYFAVWLINWHRDFDTEPWKDRQRARQLVNQGLSMLNDSPTADKLNPIIGQLINLLPQNAVPEGVPAGLLGSDEE